MFFFGVRELRDDGLVVVLLEAEEALPVAGVLWRSPYRMDIKHIHNYNQWQAQSPVSYR